MCPPLRLNGFGFTGMSIPAVAAGLAAMLVAQTALAPGALAQPRQPVAGAAPAKPAASAPVDPNAEKIVAVVNGDVITTGDVVARARLFALSTGLPITPDVLERLRPQVVKQLIDERLRLQEAQRRKIAVTDNEIAEAIGEIEQRNGLPAGRLMAQLKGQGVALRTLIDQVRVQIGWSRVLRQELGDKTTVSDADIAEANREFQLQIGKPEYEVGEIFIPIDDPAKAGDAQKFAETVINELHQGAPFGVVAAQFSQSQTALQGGDLGWVSPQQLDPAVASVIAEMPVGAISNPTRVPGGIDIVTLRAKRDIGRERSTVVHLRQVFLPFQGQLNPQAPTAQQRGAVDQAQLISRSVHSCSDMEEANRKSGATRPADPGEVRLEGVGSPPLRALLASTPIGQATKPIVSSEGVAVLMICSREDKVAAAPSKAETTSRLVEQRAELVSRQLQRDLRRRAVLDERANS
jgi:peptidyl-prolyl cis-trans isomerase SurA